jgi:multiple sugar transport system substrate-binding protein
MNLNKSFSRRQFLKSIGAGAAAAGMLHAFPHMALLAQDDTKWVSGSIPSDISATFNYTGWEGVGEVEKFQLHFDEFFKTYYPNVDVVGNPGVEWGSYWTTLPAQLAGGSPIDMCWMHDSRVQLFGDNNWLLPMDDYLATLPPPGWPEKFWASQVESFQYQGKQYGFPYDWAPGGFYVNVDMFEEAGLDLPTEDSTWDDILEMAKVLSKDTNGDGEFDQWGISNLATGWPGGFYWITKEFGGDFWNEDITESRLNEQGTIDSLQFVHDLMWVHKVHPTADMLAGTGFGPELAFASGLIGMHYALNDTAQRFVETIGDKFNWTVAPSPTGPNGRYQFVGGSAFSIPSTSTQPEMAYELIRFTLSNPAGLPTTAEMGSAYVSQKDFADLVVPADSPIRAAYAHTFRELGERDGIHPVYHPKYQEFEASIWLPNFDPLWVGEADDAAPLAQAAHEQLNALLQS